jgi:hypothetical protein
MGIFMNMPNKNSILFIFLDGFGLGKADENNPLYIHGLPGLERKIGCKLLTGNSVSTSSVLLKGIDACLGVSGIPQSATGQTALFTGKNAPSQLGFHLPAFPNQQLIEIIHSHSVIKQVIDIGLRATFANAYSKTYFEKIAQGKHTHSVTTHCVYAANIPVRTTDNMQQGDAVYWDITRAYLHSTEGIEPISPKSAGTHLSSIASKHELTIFECFATDLIGHSTSMEKAANILSIIDEFICGILDTLPENISLLLSSDHGNIEDLSVGSHTKNAVPLLVIGPAASFFSSIYRIDQITPAIIDLFRRSTAIQ